MRPFRISEVDLDPECREVRVEGELDLSVVDQFKERLDVAATEDIEVLVCLERCDFIDSTGIAAIIFAHKLMVSRGRRLLVCNPSGQVSRILAVTGLNDVGLIFPSTDAALAERFGPGGHPVLPSRGVIASGASGIEMNSQVLLRTSVESAQRRPVS
jgi:anti-anti-sigma factor